MFREDFDDLLACYRHSLGIDIAVTIDPYLNSVTVSLPLTSTFHITTSDPFIAGVSVADGYIEIVISMDSNDDTSWIDQAHEKIHAVLRECIISTSSIDKARVL